MKVIRFSDLRQGRWRNGMGVSWDIASEPSDAGAGDFGWRLAIARIDADVPFSHYPETDRVFTLIEGNGLDLDFSGRDSLAVHHAFVPHPYPCDVETYCRLRDGPCRALNLFTKRSAWRAGIDILSGNAVIAHPGPILFFVLTGGASVNGETLGPGDTLMTEGHGTAAVDGLLYAAMLSRA